jgi:beta-lactamase superfamily II metal-dependent hydrolase
MIPRLTKRGTSFKGVCKYILSDAGKGKDTSDRVLWSKTCNLASAPEDAWFEMFAVARDQAVLKEQAGQQARGRKNRTPVLHYTLSWPPGEKPSAEHMHETALSSLKALKLDQHQALIAAHGDKDHMHVHIVVNTIHPETGMTAALKYTKETLSRWAEAYEREHGIHCEERIRNNELRDNIRIAKKARASNTSSSRWRFGDSATRGVIMGGRFNYRLRPNYLQ